MIKVSILYPNEAGSNFDHAYYRDSHMPMVKERLGDACLRFAIDKGLGGPAPGSPAPYHAIGELYFNSVADFGAAMAPHGKEINADIKNYTSVKPVMQISEVVVG